MPHYSVDLTAGVTESLFTDLKQLAGDKLRERKRLTEITLELLQNIRKHAADLQTASLIIYKHKTTYSIYSINRVVSNRVNLLKQKITDLNKLDQTHQKECHKRILSQITAYDQGGLGLYRIALRSASLLRASFNMIDQRYTSFSLHVTLNT